MLHVLLLYYLSCILYVLCYSCSLEECGSTALGPALVVSIAMAAKVPGSRVSEHVVNVAVLCSRVGGGVY